jgi:ADP-ribose pyrophosphatase
MEFIEKLSKRRRIYAGKAVHFSADEIILPDGRTASREYMEHPGAVAVIPFLDTRRIVLVKQYRYPVQEVTYELPAGKIDPGETLATCVKRELQEETGYRAGTIKKLVSYWPTPAFSNEVIHIYHAGRLSAAEKSPDEDEFIDHVVMDFTRALALVDSGKIRDSKTVIGLLYWARRAGKPGKRAR